MNLPCAAGASEVVFQRCHSPRIRMRDAKPLRRQDMLPIEHMYENMRPLLQAARPEDAFQALRNVVRSFPDFAGAHHDIGVLYYRSGDGAEGAGAFRARRAPRARQRDVPDQPGRLLPRGALARRRRPRAVRSGPGHPAERHDDPDDRGPSSRQPAALRRSSRALSQGAGRRALEHRGEREPREDPSESWAELPTGAVRRSCTPTRSATSRAATRRRRETAWSNWLPRIPNSQRPTTISG